MNNHIDGYGILKKKKKILMVMVIFFGFGGQNKDSDKVPKFFDNIITYDINYDFLTKSFICLNATTISF